MFLKFIFILGPSWWLSGEESAGYVGDMGSIRRSGRSPGERNGNPLSILAWEIPWTEQPGGLQSTGSQTVRHDLAATFLFDYLFVCFPKDGQQKSCLLFMLLFEYFFGV